EQERPHAFGLPASSNPQQIRITIKKTVELDFLFIAPTIPLFARRSLCSQFLAVQILFIGVFD
ncbi:hypothetical protein, partial [Burkholderia ambifaria]|uniref:hypothetical protein n=1 Tax=Burkholderia ambifaria TaxID=152480 RepID=UPI001E5774C4